MKPYNFGKSCIFVVTMAIATMCGVQAAPEPRPHGGDDLDSSTRIVGGREAFENEIPYVVSLQADFQKGNGTRHYCGGSIYSKKFIITAAHCFDNEEKFINLRIVAGSLDRDNIEKGQVMKPKRRILHPDYDISSNENDIAVIELERELVFNSAVQPIPIAAQGEKASGKATISGWGETDVKREGGPMGHKAEQLMTVDVGIVPRPQCDKYYDEIPHSDARFKSKSTGTGFTHAAPSAICAGHLPGGAKDSCQGDSGGPLQCSRYVGVVGDGGHVEKYLCGIVSDGHGCGLKLPASYTDVARFHDWIVENAKS